MAIVLSCKKYQLMTNDIKCPNCGHIFDVENVIAADLEKKFQNEYQNKLQESLNKIEQNEKRFEAEKLLFEEKKKNENELFVKRIQNEKIKIEAEMQEQLTKSISSNFENRIKILQQEKNDNEKIQFFSAGFFQFFFVVIFLLLKYFYTVFKIR